MQIKFVSVQITAVDCQLYRYTGNKIDTGTGQCKCRQPTECMSDVVRTVTVKSNCDVYRNCTVIVSQNLYHSKFVIKDCLNKISV